MSAPSPLEPAPFDPATSQAFSPWRSYSFLVAVLLLALRTVYAAFPNLFPEEAYYWAYAKHLDYGYLDHPPMVAWLIALGTAIFGDTEFGVRVFAIVSSTVTSFFVYRLTALLYDRRAAAVAFLAVQVLPFFFLAGLVMTPDAPLTACWAGMLYSLARVFFMGRPWAWFGVGVTLGLGMLSKYTIALLGPATLLFLALDAPSRFWFRHAAPYLAVAFSVVLFSPVLWWNAAHHWASFAFQTTGRTQVRRHFALHELAGTIVGVLTPVGIWGTALALGFHPPPGSLPRADLSRQAPDFRHRRRLFARVFTLVPLSVFVLFSLTHRVKLNWTGPLWLAVIPALAAQLVPADSADLTRPPIRWLRYTWVSTVGICALLYALILQQLSFGLPGVKYSKNIELLPVGWRELAQETEKQKAALELTTGGPVYLVGMDRNFITSELVFYQTDQKKAVRETTGAHLFRGESLMYETWSPAAEFEGATLLLVGLLESELDPGRLRADSAGPLQTYNLLHNGKMVRPYYTRVIYHYRSVAPAKSVPRPE